MFYNKADKKAISAAVVLVHEASRFIPFADLGKEWATCTMCGIGTLDQMGMGGADKRQQLQRPQKLQTRVSGFVHWQQHHEQQHQQ